VEATEEGVRVLEAHKLTISDASSLISAGKLSPVDLLDALLRRIDRLEPKIDAWVTIDKDRAIDEAERLESEAEDGLLRGPLHGIPVGVKDIFYTKGLRTTMGSPIYRDFVPAHDAAAVAKLREAGAIILGKTETTEFALSDPAPTRNPWNMEHTPGGSSSGSAAAVSSGMCPTALGTQTGGSVIRPASFCGVVGMKPTYDLISRKGVYPLSWSLDHVGFFTRTVEDAALMLGVFAKVGGPQGWKPSDDVAPPRLGLLGGFFEEHADEEVWSGFLDAVERLRGTGAEVEEVPLPPSFGVVHATHRLIMASEAASVHQDNFTTRRDEYRAGIRGLVSSGLLVPASAYIRAQRIRGRFICETEKALKSVDCLVTPSAPTPALRGLESTGDPAFNAPWSLCGFPAVTVPSELTRVGLPLGMQLVDGHFREAHLLEIAHWCEAVLGFGKAPRDAI
jgi:aspartyl-tRNA(Asn)/glutamyl-tRNA(Gln) amidotransferase subunit A